MTALHYGELVSLVRGAVSDAPCPLCGPGRRRPENRKRRTLRIWQSSDGFASYYCARCGIRGWARENEARGWLGTVRTACPGTISPAQPDAAQQARIESALNLWQESKSLDGTLGWRYFAERRGLPIGRLELDHCLRWHANAGAANGGAIIGLMVDPITGEATGIHRTFIARDGTKLERKMLGRRGVIRLSPYEVVTTLGIVEGVEDGLALLLNGTASPVWCATCCGAIERFPVLEQLEQLHIFGDNDDAGEAAAKRLTARYEEAGKRVRLHWPPDEFKDWCAALADGGAA